MSQIVTLTVNPALDKSTQVENVVPEDKLRCATPSWQPGGGGINVARVVQRLGGAVLAIYPAGGWQGAFFQELLSAEEIPQKVVAIAGMTRESFAVRELSSNNQFRFSVPGPNLSEAECHEILQVLKRVEPLPRYLVLSGGLAPGIPDDFYKQLIQWADGQNIRVILDAHHEPLRLAMQAGVFLLKPNLRELQQVTGHSLEGEQEQHQALQELIDSGGAQYVALSLGAAGAVFASAAELIRLRAPTVTIRSTVGAGDSMVGGIVWALMEGYPPLEAVRFGVAAGAATVKSAGTELCQPEDVLALYKQIQP